MSTALHKQICSKGDVTCKTSAFQVPGHFRVAATFETVHYSWFFGDFQPFFSLTGCSSVILGTNSWPAPRSPFHSVWFVCQPQYATRAPSAGNASVQRSLPFIYTWLADVIWAGDQMGHKARGPRGVAIKGTWWCDCSGKTVKPLIAFRSEIYLFLSLLFLERLSIL